MKRILFLSLLCAAMSFASCKKDTPADPENTPVTGVTLDKSAVSIAVGSTETLVAAIAPDTAADKEVTWSSSATAVATVADGVVTGVAAGTATITVTTHDGGKTAICAVTVTAAQMTNSFSSNVSLPSADNTTDAYYNQIAMIAGAEYHALKLGTGAKTGTYTTDPLPATGNCALAFYGVGYNTKSGKIQITVNGGGSIDGNISKEIELKPNSGFTVNPPYTLTLGADNLYVYLLADITAQTTLTFQSMNPGTSGDYRVLLLGINVN